MSAAEATIRVPMAPTNPGQFFACCGLLELADRLWQGAEGWFAGDTFCLRPLNAGVEAGGERLLGELARCRLTNTMTEKEWARLDALSALKGREKTEEREEKKALEKLRRERPIVLPEPFRLHVDWFLDARSGGDRYKTWAGQQSVLDIAQAMKRPLETGGWEKLPPEEWLGQTTEEDSLPFYFDSDLSGQASAIDVGFSFDPLKIGMRTRPLIELGAFLGLQRFRPRADAKENRHTFALWSEPLPPEVAAVAACGLLELPGTRCYAFRLLNRTKYLKSFLPAQPLRGDA